MNSLIHLKIIREGIKTDNGTIVYNNNRRSVSAGVQAVQEKVKGEVYEQYKNKGHYNRNFSHSIGIFRLLHY